jgi:predicted ATP-dependent endonuclease of OLD family
MKLIKSIEIGYFRSIYKQKLDKLSDLTIFFGRNDAGKSNFLRALNLFFNGATNPDMPFDFHRDFNHSRIDEAKEGVDIRKFVYVKITFSPPSNWTNSLGREFWVKKTWSVSRGGEPISENSLESAKQQFVTRFLNKIHLHYIPAIKDRTIFENLLESVYKVISSNDEFLSSLGDFTSELQSKTEKISSELLSQIGVESAIAPPVDLTDLFRSLDFETKNSYGDKYSLTLQNGDGVQVRHIPAILSFLSDNSSESFHIWAFEEPENSLELANAVQEAQIFLNYSMTRNKQIFITSHSPAFFTLENSSTKRFFIYKSKDTGLNKELSKECSCADIVNSESIPSSLMGETPLLPVISNYLKEAGQTIEQLKNDVESINRIIDEERSPILFLEGESDRIILEKSWEYFGSKEIGLRFVDCSGTTKMKSLSQDGPILSTLGSGRLIFVLVDNDKEGRDLSKHNNARLSKNDGGNWVQHNSNKSFWCRLQFSKSFIQKMKELKIPTDSWPFTIENCFSEKIHQEAISEQSLKFSEIPHDELINCTKAKKVIFPLLKSNPTTYILAPDEDYKVKFAEWVINHANSKVLLEYFKPVIEGILTEIQKSHAVESKP